MNESINPDADADATAEDTEGHRLVTGFDKAPNNNDDDDTEGHRLATGFDKAPGISGALNTDPKTQS